jgi:hypothetical protein
MAGLHPSLASKCIESLAAKLQGSRVALAQLNIEPFYLDRLAGFWQKRSP